MRALLLVAGAAALLAAPAWAEPPMSAQDFVNAAAQSDFYEIQAANVVLKQSDNAQVRGFAQMMIDDHTRTSEALRQAAMASSLPPPPMALSGDQQGMLSALQSMKSPDLERAYITQQVNAHTSALVTEQGYAASGADPNLRKAAQSAVPIIQHHLEMARQMKAASGG